MRGGMSMAPAVIASGHSGVAKPPATRYNDDPCREPLILPDNFCWRCPVWVIAILITR
jgi:hypothetical protein